MKAIRATFLAGTVAALLLALGNVNAHAAGGGAKCVSTSGDITNVGSDGSTCEAQADSGGKAASTAKGDSDATAVAGNNGRAITSAKDMSTSVAQAPNGGKANSKAIHSGQAVARTNDNGGKTTAKANNGAAVAETSAAGGKANAKATNTVLGSGGGADAFSDTVCNTTASAVGTGAVGYSQCGNVDGGTAKARSKNSLVIAEDLGGGKAIVQAVNTGTGTGAPNTVAETYGVCNANANAKGTGSQSLADCGNTADGGKAEAKATRGGIAVASAAVKCSAKANATTGGHATALCTTSEGYVNATASGGGVAQGSDTNPPVCDTSSGGKAKVRSSAGNCG